MPLDHVARAGNLKGEGWEITKGFSTLGEGNFAKTPRAGGTCAFGCRTGSQARSPLAVVLGPSPLPGALGQAGVP